MAGKSENARGNSPSFIDPALYGRYQEVGQVVAARKIVADQAHLESISYDQDYYSGDHAPLYPSREAFREASSALATASRQREHELLQARRLQIGAASTIAKDVVDRHWERLEPLERRMLDVSASGRLGFMSEGETPIYKLIECLNQGQHLPPEVEYVRRKNDAVLGNWYWPNDIHKMYRFAAEVYGYGSTFRHSTNALGAHVFGLQRTMTNLADDLIQMAFMGIPEEYTINRRNISSYFHDVIGKGRAFSIDEDGIRLTISPHVEEPYSDDEWAAGLEKQLEQAPKVAKAIVADYPSVAAITVYGPLTRESRGYRMFHPKEPLQLGAVFRTDDRAEVYAAINSMEAAAEDMGITAQAGTEHDSGSTWNEANLASIRRLNDRLRTKWFTVGDPNRARGIEEFFALHSIAELHSQVNKGAPLEVPDVRTYRRAKRLIGRHYGRYIQPIFDRVHVLTDHMDQGYPYPLEYAK